jgi:NADPH:quinone reductase-like Zn-dependent oxidoreductase
MRALALIEEGRLEPVDRPEPPPPAAGEVQVRMRRLALNHIDLWGARGMAFVKRKLPIVAGVEGAGEIVALGEGVEGLAVGDRAALYAGLVCRTCRRCREGRENLCENVAGIMGFHVDGLARERLNIPAHLAFKVPDGVAWSDAACAPLTFATVQHMLFDNAKLEAGEWILIHAGGSGIGSTAILMAKQAGATVIATAGSDAKLEKMRRLGADHVVNYATERFESIARRLTGKRGVDVVFEHIGPATWAGSLLSLAKGGRLVTCGSTSGIAAETNLFHLFQQQLRIVASFGANFRNLRESLAKMAAGLKPVIDSEIALEEMAAGVERLKQRDVFGKIVVRMD